MMKSICLTGSLLSLLCCSAAAEQFATAVDVNKRIVELSVVEQTAMVLPQVSVDSEVQNGSLLCDTSGFDQFPTKTYCNGSRANGSFLAVGAPNSSISINLPQQAIVQNGLSLTLKIAKSKGTSAVVGSDGSVAFEVVGELTLQDKTALENEVQVFNFELTAVYN